jgi:hypothetical protein
MSRLATRRLALAALALFAVFGLFSYSQRTGDFAGYLLVGDLVLDGGHVYVDAPAGVNTWPPLFSLVCAPLALIARLSPTLARGLWVVLNYAAVLLLLDVLARLVYGKRLSLRAVPPGSESPAPPESTREGEATGKPESTGEYETARDLGATGECETVMDLDANGRSGISLASAAIFVPLLLSSRWLLANFEHLQVNILIFLLALGGLYLISTRREGLGALALGLGAALKVMPIVFVPYLAYRRRWRAATLVAMAAAVYSLVPVLIYGWSRYWDYVVAWRTEVAAGWGVSAMNHSVFAMLDRFIGHGILPFTSGDIDGLSESGSPWVTTVMLFILAAVAAHALWASRGPVQQGSWASLCEWSIVFIVAVLFGPVARLYYFVVLLLPNVLLFAVWRAPSFTPAIRRLAAIALFVPFALGTLASPELVGDRLSTILEMSSVLTLAVLVALSGLLNLRSHLPAEQAWSD